MRVFHCSLFSESFSTQASSWARLLDNSRFASACSSRSLALFSKVVTASAPAGNRSGGSSWCGEAYQCVGEFGGIAALLAVHALPGGDGLLGPLGVVGDRGLGVLRRLRREQLGAEEAGLDQHGADPERRNLRGQRLHPALHPELRGGVGGQEIPAWRPAVEEIVTISPDRWARMTGRAARVTLIGPNRVVSICARNSSG